MMRIDAPIAPVCRSNHITKITRPRISDVLERSRLFHLLDLKRKAPVCWISGPGGSGKTTLVASYLDARKLQCLWYRLDDGDADIATFFYYMGLAGKKAASRFKKPLPLLTPEYLLGIPTFTRRYFEELFFRLSSSHFSSPSILKPASSSALRLTPHGFFLVLDNYQEVPETSPFHDMIKHGLSNIPEAINVIVLSRSASKNHHAEPCKEVFQDHNRDALYQLVKALRVPA